VRVNPLRERWLSHAGEGLAAEVTARLVAGRSLDGLDLGVHEGRVDLRLLALPIPQRLERYAADRWFVEELHGHLIFRGQNLVDLDLTGAQMQGLRFFDAEIVNCRLDRGWCQDWRLWNTSVRSSTFVRADLRGSVLGSWHNGLRNRWSDVDLSSADLRGVVSDSAVYDGCDFSRAKLGGLRFAQCTLTDCRFAGHLRGVVFDGRSIEGHAVPEPLRRVDFSETVFTDVSFKGYQLEGVMLPDDPDLLVINNFRCVAERILTELEASIGPDRNQRMLLAEFRGRLKGFRAEKEAEVLNLADYRRSGGDSLAALLVELVEGRVRRCGV
jgi:uncharacterized protein YjbI with pentapeptide repeats